MDTIYLQFSILPLKRIITQELLKRTTSKKIIKSICLILVIFNIKKINIIIYESEIKINFLVIYTYRTIK